MLVCLCKGVSDRIVRLAVASGATTVDGVGARCGAGTDCGGCRHAIQDMIEDLGAADGGDRLGAVAQGCCENDSGLTAAPVSAAAGA
jgi:bacterioferritin-associated ferredoxin